MNVTGMIWSRRCVVLVVIVAAGKLQAAEPMKFCRFRVDGKPSYGIVEGDRVRAINQAPWLGYEKTDRTFAVDEIKFLPPSQPTQVLALAGNYKSHLNDAQIPPKFKIPQPFLKSPSCLIGHGSKIVLPRDAGPTHYEGELVIVIGKLAKKVSKEAASQYVFGVTAGNDVSERYWQNEEQNKDVQWWRAKGADSFGPCGPFIATGLDYNKLQLKLRLNGQVKQDENTSQMIHDIASIVSFISQYVTLKPGDLIFTGTSGTTEEIKPGDVVEVELEGVGTLRNTVVRAR
jgi:2-keto-4-pentenoate hydratase/2-oxohepta-3-ene-1,7-dioic acid hydratase in catechol pathway